MSEKRTRADQAIEYIRAKDRKTKTEVEFLNLLDKTSRTPGENQLFEACLIEQIARQRTREAKKERSRVLVQHRKAEGDAARKARTKAMIEASGLLEMAGIIDAATGELLYDASHVLGILLAAKQVCDDPTRRAEFQSKGQRYLDDHAAIRTTRPGA